MLKDSKSLETCCYVIGAGAFGIFFRWMQLQLAFDNGLPGKSVWHFFVLLLIAASAAVFWYFIRKFEKAGLSLSGNFFEALSNGGKGPAISLKHSATRVSSTPSCAGSSAAFCAPAAHCCLWARSWMQTSPF